MLIGEKIKELRQAKGLSQCELAKIIECSQPHISEWEKGLVEPHIFNLILLADVFNVSLDELCCRDFKKEEMSNG